MMSLTRPTREMEPPMLTEEPLATTSVLAFTAGAAKTPETRLERPARAAVVNRENFIVDEF